MPHRNTKSLLKSLTTPFEFNKRGLRHTCRNSRVSDRMSTNFHKSITSKRFKHLPRYRMLPVQCTLIDIIQNAEFAITTSGLGAIPFPCKSIVGPTLFNRCIHDHRIISEPDNFPLQNYVLKSHAPQRHHFVGDACGNEERDWHAVPTKERHHL